MKTWKKKIKNKRIPVAVGIIHKADKIMITKTSAALLNGLWGFPVSEGTNAENAKEQLLGYLRETLKSEINSIKEIGSAKHIFTHKTWMMTLYEINCPEQLKEEVIQQYDTEKTLNQEKIEWVTKNNLAKYLMATAFKKLLTTL